MCPAMNSKEGRQEEQRLVFRRKRWIRNQTEGQVRGIVDEIREEKKKKRLKRDSRWRR